MTKQRVTLAMSPLAMMLLLSLLALNSVLCVTATVSEFTARDMHQLVRVGTPVPIGNNLVVYTVRRFVRIY